MTEYADGHYWARHHDGTTFVVLREDGHWYCCGVCIPIDDEFSEAQIICAVKRPDN